MIEWPFRKKDTNKPCASGLGHLMAVALVQPIGRAWPRSPGSGQHSRNTAKRGQREVLGLCGPSGEPPNVRPCSMLSNWFRVSPWKTTWRPSCTGRPENGSRPPIAEKTGGGAQGDGRRSSHRPGGSGGPTCRLACGVPGIDGALRARARGRRRQGTASCRGGSGLLGPSRAWALNDSEMGKRLTRDAHGSESWACAGQSFGMPVHMSGPRVLQVPEPASLWGIGESILFLFWSFFMDAPVPHCPAGSGSQSRPREKGHEMSPDSNRRPYGGKVSQSRSPTRPPTRPSNPTPPCGPFWPLPKNPSPAPP